LRKSRKEKEEDQSVGVALRLTARSATAINPTPGGHSERISGAPDASAVVGPPCGGGAWSSGCPWSPAAPTEERDEMNEWFGHHP